MSNDMKTRITQITLTPGELFHERAFTISVIDEGGGEFLEVKSLDTCQTIRVDDDEWPHLREAIDRMVGEIKQNEDNPELKALLETPAPWEQDFSESHEEYVEPLHDPPDGWIPWDGGEESLCPLGLEDKLVAVHLRWEDEYEQENTMLGIDWNWSVDGDECDILAYKVVSEEKREDEEEPVDDYGNPLSGDRIIYCCFPDCGCDGARLCQAEKGASPDACAMNIERGSLKDLF